MAGGLSSRHWPHFENGVDIEALCAPDIGKPDKVLRHLAPIIDAYDAHSDVPYAGLYKELSESYPDAYFVLTRRNLISWWHSLIDHWALWALPRRLDPFEAIQYRPYVGLIRRPLWLFDGRRLMDAHAKHVEDVEHFFAGNPRFLSLDITDDDKGERFGALIGRPSVAFAKSNPRHPKSERLKVRLRALGGKGRQRPGRPVLRRSKIDRER